MVCHYQHNGRDPAANRFSGVTLSCGLHVCPQRCHQLLDHSKMDCIAIVVDKCPQNHKITRKCHDKAAMTCRKCAAEARAKLKRQKRDYDLDQLRQEKQRAYAAQLAELDDEIEHEKRVQKNQAEDEDRQNAIAQKKRDLSNLKDSVCKARNTSSAPKSNDHASAKPESSSAPKATPTKHHLSGQPSLDTKMECDTSAGASKPAEEEEKLPDMNESEAKDDWDWQKEYEGAENDALDSLMAMIGTLL